MAAVDFFLKLGDIDGESTARGHEKWIEIESFSWGVSNAGATATGGGSGTGRAVPSDFTFVIPMTSASPKILDSVFSGEHIKTAELSARKAGGEQSGDFLKWKLTDVLVSSYNTEGGGDSPMESIALRFAKVEISYATQKPDGSLATAITSGWDLKLNTKV